MSRGTAALPQQGHDADDSRGERTVSRPGVLLDRDGTIIVDHGYVGSVDRVEFIPGSIEAIAALNAADIPVAVVTNQAGVARGFYDIDDVHQVHKHMIAELARKDAHVDVWLFCPYHPDGKVAAFARTSADRKPAPGMALAAAEALDLDLTSSWVVGDAACDMGLAEAIGAQPLYVGPPDATLAEVRSFPDLARAAEHILASRSVPRQVRGGPQRFPTRRFTSADAYGGAYVTDLDRAVRSVDRAQLGRAADILDVAYRADNAVFACGNGGSASIANHLQCDHVKGVRNGTDLTTRVYSLSTNIETLSAIANDHGYERVFEYQLQSNARPGDVLVAISSSGGSPNIVRALEWANAYGMPTIALTGFDGGAARRLATATIHVDAHNYGIIEDAHQACMHLLAQYVRQSRMAADVVASHTF